MSESPRFEEKKSLEVWSPPQRDFWLGHFSDRAQIRRGRDEEPTLSDYLHVVRERAWAVAGIAFACVAAALVYLLLATPQYQSNTLIQVEAKSGEAAGLGDLLGGRGDNHTALGEPESGAEIEILRSRMLLGAVVEELGLDREAYPRRLPVIGAAIARRYSGTSPAPPLLGLSQFCWGGEQIRLSRLEVPDDLLDEPMRLTALDDGRYRLEVEDEVLVEGKVGILATSRPDRPVSILVSELVARPRSQFVVAKRRRASVVEALQDDLRITEKAKKTGILVLSLEGPDPAKVASILDAISTRFLRQTLERSSAEVTHLLDFLESQLPVLKRNVEAAEAALNAFQQKRGAINLSMESQALIAQSVDIEKELSALEQQRAELRQRYTDHHPTLAAISAKTEKLLQRQTDMSARLRGLPTTEMDSARLTRDVKVATELYVSLLGRAQQLRVAKSGAISDAVVIDKALVPFRPSAPKPQLVLMLATLLGLGAGLAAALGGKSLARGTQDSEEVERGTGLPVIAAIPRSESQVELVRSAVRRRQAALPVLSELDPEDPAIENLRALRTSLQFALAGPQRNIVAVLGSGPEVGKSFVSVNLAHVLAAADRKVLLIDGDLRRGRLHRYFGVARKPGVADVVNGTVALDDALLKIGRLDVLPAGTQSANPAELLAGSSFEKLLAEASRRYEIVVVDTAPVLAVADALIVARLASVNLLVFRALKSPVREVGLAVRRLAHSGIQVQGIVLNDVREERGMYGLYRTHDWRPKLRA
jgi:tyrosine-protein kinase Etk/Wzc